MVAQIIEIFFFFREKPDKQSTYKDIGAHLLLKRYNKCAWLLKRNVNCQLLKLVKGI